jgi:hypothetical protein
MLSQHNLVAQDESGQGGCASLPQSLQTHCRDVAFTFLLANTERSIEEDRINNFDIADNGNNETASGFVEISGTDVEGMNSMYMWTYCIALRNVILFLKKRISSYRIFILSIRAEY